MTLWTGSGLFNIEIGQVIMIAVGLLLLFLAIRKGLYQREHDEHCRARIVKRLAWQKEEEL